MKVDSKKIVLNDVENEDIVCKSCDDSSCCVDHDKNDEYVYIQDQGVEIYRVSLSCLKLILLVQFLKDRVLNQKNLDSGDQNVLLRDLEIVVQDNNDWIVTLGNGCILYGDDRGFRNLSK